MNPFDQLRERLARVYDLNAAAAVLEWDQETYMPDGGAAARAQQIATLRQLAHEHLTDDAVGTLLDGLAPEVEGQDPYAFEAALVRVTREDYDRATKLPARLVADLAEASALAKQAWRTAREQDDFPAFAPHLRRLLDLSVEKAEAYGYEDHLYDALLDEYEPGMRTATVARVFTDLRRQLVPLVEAITAQPAPDDAFLHERFDPDAQWAFTMEVLRDIGYDLEHGRQDRSAHPFTTTFAITDVRLTTRIHERFLPTALFGTLHEAGHGMYEQGVALDLARTPLAQGTSLGMHESQSRLWENQIGRSRAFWRHYYPRLQARFPGPLGTVTLDDFYRAVNRVQPSLIRVEADEVTYNLHIMLRFELEQALLTGQLAVDELPEAWNDGMERMLGLRPSSDADGVLQDIHWPLGIFGYFPTYALGTLMSAQLFGQAQREMPDLYARVAVGDVAPLRAWLRERVHRWGRIKPAEAILRDVTGEGLSAEPWLAYVRMKFGELYEW